MPAASIRYPDDIVKANNNGGWHRNGKRAYRKVVHGILRFLQAAKNAHLYHLCFEPSDEASDNMTSAEMYRANMAMVHDLRQMAERKGIRCEWWAAREIADTTKKDHLHVFMIVDASGIRVAQLFNQFEDGRFQQYCKARGVEFAIFRPKDYKGIHGNNRFMRLPYQGPGNRETVLGRERLADALIWCSYLGKARSKPEDDKSGQIFPASRPNRRKKLDSPSAALPAENAIAPEEVMQDDFKGHQSDNRSHGYLSMNLQKEPHQRALGAAMTSFGVESASEVGPKTQYTVKNMGQEHLSSPDTSSPFSTQGNDSSGVGTSRSKCEALVTLLPAQSDLSQDIDPYGKIKTMCSIEVVNVINSLRGPGKAKVKHSDFMKKVRLHPGIDEGNFLGSYLGGNGERRPCYYLPKRESVLMVMSESCEVQAQVYDRMRELEAAAEVPSVPVASQTYAQSLMELAMKAQKAEAQQLQGTAKIIEMLKLHESTLA